MNVTILDGGPRDPRGASARALAAEVGGLARAGGHAVTAFELDALRIQPCRGCFACWVKHPGACAIKDDQEPVLRAMAAADLLVWVTPVTFGGYAPALKKALDRFIPNILPFFIVRRGEIHHPPRYERRRSLLVLGTRPSPDAGAEAVFHRLVGRNAVNLDSVRTDSLVVHDGEADGYRSRVAEFLAAAGGGR
jgi:hypothetical protein